MKTLEIASATAPLEEYAAQASREPIIFTRDGEPVAALVSVENTDLESLALSTHPKFIEIIEKSRARLEAEGSISGEEMRRRLGIK